MLRHRTLRWSAAVAAVLTALVASSGCGTAASPSSGGSNPSLVIAASTGGPFPHNLNPVAPVSGLSDTLSFVYEPLLQFNKLKPGSVIPWLASAHQWADGGRKLTFTIRPGVKWSDGKPFTSADAAFTFNYVKANPAINSNGLTVSTVSAPDAKTVVLTFPTPQYANLYYIGSQYMLPQHIWSGVKDPASQPNLKPVGTGPYKVSSFNAQRLTLAKNPTYWQHGKPKITRIVFPSTNDNNGPGLALQQGSANWGGIFYPQAAQYEKNSPHNHYWFPAMSNTVLLLNLTKAPLDNLALRQAINLTLDRAAVGKASTLGLVPPVTNPTMLTPFQKSFLSPTYADAKLHTSITEAKAVLQKAGFTYKGSDLYDPSGKAVALKLTNPGPLSDLVASGQEVARELGAIGIKMTQVSASVAQWQGDQTTGKFEVALRPSPSGPGPYYMYNYWLNSKLSAPIGTAATGNFERWKNPQADALLTQYASTDDIGQQKSIMYKLEDLVVKQLPVIPLQYQAFWGEYNDSQITGWPSPGDPYTLASVYDLPANELVVLNLKPRSAGT